jgi:lipopolysaccharide biosynthesis regulator YciM
MRAPDLLRTLTLLAGALAACAVTGGARAAKPDPEKLAPSVVRDLHYGDVLFFFYQDKNLDAITRLLAFDHWQRMPNSEAESKLLLAGLYLELGLNNEAGTRFEQLLTPEVPVGVRNRAWFYLGKVWYARGYLDRAEHAIREITAALPPALEAEKVSLLANILLRQGRFDEAVALLKGWHGPPDWMAFAEFNLGVALAREGRLAEADPLLTGVGTLATRRSELLALKDRANLALGFAYLQADRPAEAKSALERVRLRGPYSNKALLGTGWAYIALGDYQAALRPLLELHDRNLLDAAVQESYLAVPYAYAKLDSTAQAADAYESAIRAFDEESARLDAGIAKLRGGHLLDDLLANEAETGKYGWYWQLKALPDAVESRYLYSVLASHDFQEGLKNYRDLAALDGTLARWSDNMVAFADMIDTREKAYALRIPRTDALLASGAIDQLEAQRTALESRLNGVEAAGDFAALGSPEERDQWRRVQKIEEGLASAGATADPELAEKARLLKGVLYWRLNETWRARVWQERRSLKEIDVALREARNLWVRVQHDRSSTVADTGGFANRLGTLKTRLEALRGRLAATRAAQNDYLADLAARELEAEKGRLASYQIQARFALAAIYDRGSNPPPKPAAGSSGGKP